MIVKVKILNAIVVNKVGYILNRPKQEGWSATIKQISWHNLKFFITLLFKDEEHQGGSK